MVQYWYSPLFSQIGATCSVSPIVCGCCGVISIIIGRLLLLLFFFTTIWLYILHNIIISCIAIIYIHLAIKDILFIQEQAGSIFLDLFFGFSLLFIVLKNTLEWLNSLNIMAYIGIFHELSWQFAQNTFDFSLSPLSLHISFPLWDAFCKKNRKKSCQVSIFSNIKNCVLHCNKLAKIGLYFLELLMTWVDSWLSLTWLVKIWVISG